MTTFKSNFTFINVAIGLYIILWFSYIYSIRKEFFPPSQFADINPGIKVDSFKVIDITPKLISVRKNRTEIPLEKNYAFGIDDNLISLTFDNCSVGHSNSTFAFAVSEFGSFEDFDAPNTLNIGLPGGKYKVFVRKIDKSEGLTSKPCVIDIYHETSASRKPEFYPMLALLIFLPVILLWVNSRLLKNKKRLEEDLLIQTERNRITADLHDDMGASLSSMQINSSIAQRLIDSNIERAKVIMQKIEHQSKDVAEKLGDYIWSMKAHKDEFMSLTLRIKIFVNAILGDSDIQFNLKLDPELDKKVENVVIKKNLLLIVKEIVNNAAKYSQASHLAIDLIIANNQILLDIADNGVGFSPNKVKGNGITNIKKRVAELTGTTNIISSINGGSSFHIIIPLSL